jgi:hypothetical protein
MLEDWHLRTQHIYVNDMRLFDSRDPGRMMPRERQLEVPRSVVPLSNRGG